MHSVHARVQKDFSEGFQYSFLLFLVDEGREDPNTTKSGTSSTSQGNAMAFRWRAGDGPTFNSGLVAL